MTYLRKTGSLQGKLSQLKTVKEECNQASALLELKLKSTSNLGSLLIVCLTVTPLRGMTASFSSEP